MFKLFISFLLSINFAFAKFNLKYLGHQFFPTGFIFKNTELGGLSGCSIYQDKLYAVSDDRSRVSPARLYTFEIMDNKLVPKQVLFLKDKDGKAFQRFKVDFEAIHVDDKYIFLADEGGYLFDQASIKVFDQKGIMKQDFKLDKKYKHRFNQANESLSYFEGEFITAFENSYDEVPDEKEQTIPLIRFSIFKDKLKVNKDLSYKISSKKSLGDQFGKGSHGLVELIALSKNEFLSLERSFSKVSYKNTVKLFYNDQKSKSLVYDFKDLESKFKLDNFEAMCKKDNKIYFISDNNFNKNQQTLIVVMKIESK